jgi:hypothetical protein
MPLDQSHGPYFEWKGFVGKYAGERNPEPSDPPELQGGAVVVVLEFCFNHCVEMSSSDLRAVKVISSKE